MGNSRATPPLHAGFRMPIALTGLLTGIDYFFLPIRRLSIVHPSTPHAKYHRRALSMISLWRTTYHVENFGCRATPGRRRSHRASTARSRPRRAPALPAGRSRRAEYLHCHRRCRSGRPRRHSPHPSRKPRCPNSGDRLLRAARTRRNIRAARRRASSSAIPTSTSSRTIVAPRVRASSTWGRFVRGFRIMGRRSFLRTLAPHSGPAVIVGDIFAHTELIAAPVFDGDLREDAAQSESAGRLQ